jgi:putative endonuclease
MNKREKGIWGEEKAVKYLLEKGIEIIARNQRTSYGELDIIGRDESQIIFFEVKMRSGDWFGYPEDAVNTTKQEHLLNSIEEYMQKHPDLNDDWRLDVIAIDGNVYSSNIVIRWFKNAISCA